MILIVLVAFVIYLKFIKVEMSSTTKIICKYFDNVETEPDKMTDITDRKINDMYNSIDEISLFPIIRYEGSVYQFTGYTLDEEAVYTDKNVDLCYITNEEDVDINENITENVYELKNISIKYAFGYKNEGIYYLYRWLNLNEDTDIKEKMGNFDELFDDMNRDGAINFYEIEIFIHNHKGDSYSNKSIMCYGDIDKLLKRYIMGKKLENVGNILFGRKTGNIYRYKRAAIFIRGYMQDTKCFVVLSIQSEGYLSLFVPDLQIDTCFWIEDIQIESMCQDILNDFHLYDWDIQ